MVVEFQDSRPEAKAGGKLALEMPEGIAQKFSAHLQRKRDAETPRGRATMQAEIEATL